jgi:hypothetical protein
MSSKLTIKDGFQKDQTSYRWHDRYKEEMREAAEKALENKFREFFLAPIVEQQKFGLLWINLSQKPGQQQMVMMPPPVLNQVNTACAQSSVASTTTQSYSIDCTTTCLLFYLINGPRKTKEVTKAKVDPVGGLFEGNLILPLYACVQVEELLKSICEDHEIDIPTSDGKHFLGECISSTILWYK